MPFLGSYFSLSKGPKFNGIGAIVDEKFYKYGDLCSLFIGPRLYVVINDLQLAKDLFSRDIFSGKSYSI